MLAPPDSPMRGEEVPMPLSFAAKKPPNADAVEVVEKATPGGIVEEVVNGLDQRGSGATEGDRERRASASASGVEDVRKGEEEREDKGGRGVKGSKASAEMRERRISDDRQRSSFDKVRKGTASAVTRSNPSGSFIKPPIERRASGRNEYAMSTAKERVMRVDTPGSTVSAPGKGSPAGGEAPAKVEMNRKVK